MTRITLYLFLFFCTISSFAQKWQKHYAELENTFNSGDYAGTISQGDELLSELEGINRSKDTSFVNVLYYQTMSYFYLGDYLNAVNVAKDEVVLCKEAYGEGNYFYQQSSYLLAVLATYTADYETSIPAFEETLRLMQGRGEGETAEYVYIENQLAGIYDQAGSTFDAQLAYEDAYFKAKSLYSMEDSTMQVMTNAISSFYLLHGMYKEAEPFFLQSLDMMEKYYGKESESYVTVLNSLGEFYIYAGWYQKSVDTYTEFVTLCKKIYGVKSADYATAVNNLAVAYVDLEDFEKAEKYYLEALDIKEKVYRKESDYYALTLVNIAVLYDRMGKRQEAQDLYEEAVAIYKSINGTRSDNYSVAISSLASLYSYAGKNVEAEKLTLEALEIQKELNGEKYPTYINSLNNLGQIHSEMGKYAQAKKELQKVCDLRLEVQGADHPDYASSLMVLANVKSILQEYEEAENLYAQALGILERQLGMENTTYCNALSSLAGLYLEMGRYLESEETFLNSLELSKKIRGDQHPEHATILNNMALLYQETGRYDKAEENAKQAMEIVKASYGVDDPSLIYSSTVLANIYKDQEDYKTAEEYILMAKQLADKHFPKDHPNYLNTLHNIAVFYYELGNYDQAEPLYLLVKDGYAKTYGKEHSEYVNALNSLGAFYMSKMMYSKDMEHFNDHADKAEKYFTEVLKIDSATIDLKGQDFALHLNNAGEFYRLKGEYDLAEKFFLNAIANLIDLFGEDYPSLGVNYNNLALLYDNMGDHEKAIEYYSKSIAIKESHYGSKSPSLANSYVSLASILGQEGKEKEAYEYFSKGFGIDGYNIELNFSFLSSEERLNYVNNSRYYVDLFNSFASEHQKDVDLVSGLMYDNELRNKGLILKSSNQMKEQVYRSGDTVLYEQFGNWIAHKKELANQLSLPEDKRTMSIDTLEALVNSLEKDLTRSIYMPQGLGTKNWKEVQESLQENQAAIEFTYFYKQADSIYPVYGAVVLRKEMELPVYIELCTEAALLDLLGEYGGNNLAYVNKVYGKLGNLNTDLFELIWKPMMNDLKGANEVFFAPTNLLNKVSFSAIGVSGTQYLTDLYLLEQVSSTGTIGTLNKQMQINDIALFGGAKYSQVEDDDDIWKYLPATKTEVENIARTFKEMNLPERSYIGITATEEQFKELEFTPSSIVHVATHGFFYPDPDEIEDMESVVIKDEEVRFRGGSKGYETFVNNKNPLMRSGIVFTGANNVWKESEEGKEDGVLTAFEVSNLYLKGVQLVVLSACETGLGEIKGSEGVYGLQRAFKSAGVEQLVMSLWQVPDKETQEFMNHFYQELLKTGSTHAAFRATQQMMKQHLDPYFWGAFVLVE